MAFETIVVDVEDHVATIRLDRPEAMNALNQQLLKELAQALREAEANERVRCIILTGSDKAFAAGADVREMAEMSFVEAFRRDLFEGDALQILRCRKPVIAAVAGYALGGGCELAMMCDFVIAADTAKFGQPEINLGVVAGIGGTQRLTRLVGRSKSMDLHLTGRSMTARGGGAGGAREPRGARQEAHGGGARRGRAHLGEVDGGGDGRQGGRQPCRGGLPRRGHPLRAPALPRALRHGGPGRGHVGLRREARTAVPRSLSGRRPAPPGSFLEP